MGITIRNALKLDKLKTFRMVAGAEGIGTTVESVGILEHEIVSGIEGAFFKGDLVLTSLYPIKDEPGKVVGVVKELVRNEVSCLAVKNIYYKEIPEEAVRYADEKEFPIFVYDGEVCLEDIVYEVVKALKDDADDAYLASKIHGLIGAPMGRDVVRRIAYEINGSFDDRVFAACFIPDGDPREMASAINNGPYREPADKALAFGDSVLMIHSTNDPELDRGALFGRIGRNGKWTNLGTSGALCGIGELDKAVLRALSAGKVARGYGKGEVDFDGMGLYRFLAPGEDNYWIRSFYEDTAGRLMKHDERYGGELMETAEAFVLFGGDYSKAAGKLHIHVNTVRYRIGKIKELFDTDGELTDFREELSIAVRLHKIANAL